MKKVILFLVISLFIVSTLTQLIDVVKNELAECPEKSKETLYDKEMYSAMKHQRSWSDFDYNSYCSSFSINKYEQDESREYFNSIIPYDDNTISYAQFYGKIYDSICQHDYNKLTELEDSLINIKNSYNLNNIGFANMIVTFIQDIPYSYVFSKTNCSDRKHKNLPCISGNRFGLLTPIEFMYTLSGDCDTRAVLLYLFLKKFGYDPLIVVSNEYAHAMLAVNLPGQGDYISYENKNYYFWETTATGWSMGLLPPDCSNVDYWEVALH